MEYHWQDKDWANFRYNREAIHEIVPAFLEKSAVMEHALQGLNTAEQQEEIVRFMISEAINTSEIEGEYISRQDLMSSIKNRLGLSATPETVKDKRAIAVTNLLVAVRNSYDKKLTESDIKHWHSLLFESTSTERTRTESDKKNV